MKGVHMNRIVAAIASSILCAAAPAWAVNKCVGPNGAVVFQDAPCAGKGETITVRPASGSGKGAPTNEAEPATIKPQSEAQRIEQKIAESQKARRLQELQVRLIPDAEAAINRHRTTCDRDLAALSAKKNRANNNLAGATWEVSISSEMTAIATRCDTKARDLKDEADRLRTECRDLGGCK